MKLSEAIREWKRKITTHMAVEYVLTLRADINAFSDAAQALERENEKLRKQIIDLKCDLGDELEDLEGYNQTLRDRLRQQTELRVKAEAENERLRRELCANKGAKELGSEVSQ